MESVKVPQKEFIHIESKFEHSSTFEEILVVIEHMSTLTLKHIKKSEFFNETKKKCSKPTNELNYSSCSGLASSNYENLEKLVQKYEAEIREHIKIEQQMKIYSDNLEEKILEFENFKVDDDLRFKNMEREIERLKNELDYVKNGKQVIKTKIQLGSGGGGLVISVPKHRKTQSIDTVY